MRPTQDSQSSSDTAMRHETSTPLRRQRRRGFTYSTRQESQSPSPSNTTMHSTQDSERSPTSVCETQLLQDSQDSQYSYSVSGSQHLQDSQDSQNSDSVSGSQPLQEANQLNVDTKVIVNGTMTDNGTTQSLKLSTAIKHLAFFMIITNVKVVSEEVKLRLLLRSLAV